MYAIHYYRGSTSNPFTGYAISYYEPHRNKRTGKVTWRNAGIVGIYESKRTAILASRLLKITLSTVKHGAPYEP